MAPRMRRLTTAAALAATMLFSGCSSDSSQRRTTAAQPAIAATLDRFDEAAPVSTDASGDNAHSPEEQIVEAVKSAALAGTDTTSPPSPPARMNSIPVPFSMSATPETAVAPDVLNTAVPVYEQPEPLTLEPPAPTEPLILEPPAPTEPLILEPPAPTEPLTLEPPAPMEPPAPPKPPNPAQQGEPTAAPEKAAERSMLVPIARLTGNLAPKSVVASDTGLYVAQNMMYRHTVSVFNAAKDLVATLEDSVDLRSFGYDVAGDSYRGSPVEAAFNSDGSEVFVSNYRMYGPGFNSEAGSDSCGKGQGQRSFVYRIDTDRLVIKHVYEVGPVPKHLAVTHDDGLLLVSNWCGYDISVFDLKTHERLAEIEVGRYPRGIAVTNEDTTAYVAVMGSTSLAVIDLVAVRSDSELTASEIETGAVSYFTDVGASPRHVVLSPDNKTIYVSLNAEDAVVALDASTGVEIGRALTGDKPRTMDIADDGSALYVVNYGSHTLTKLRTRDMSVLQRINTAPKPIGVTYDSFSNEVWVSTYSGVIHVYAEHAEAAEDVEAAGDDETAEDAEHETPAEPSEPKEPA